MQMSSVFFLVKLKCVFLFLLEFTGLKKCRQTMCLIHFLKLIHVKESFHKLKGANSNFGFHFGTSIHVMYTDGHKSIQISGPKRFQKGYISQFIDFCV